MRLRSQISSCICWIGLLLCFCWMSARAATANPAYWQEPMKKVHVRFTGTKGTFAQFGDSITVTMAYWAPLRYEQKNLSPEAARVYSLVKQTMKPDCWDKWKGPEYGSTGSMTIRWAHDHVDEWLKKH